MTHDDQDASDATDHSDGNAFAIAEICESKSLQES
jgi:hypothetical protein